MSTGLCHLFSGAVNKIFYYNTQLKKMTKACDMSHHRNHMGSGILALQLVISEFYPSVLTNI